MAVIQRYGVLILTLYIAFVFVQSLFFKFANAPETVHIFGTLDEWAGSFGAGGLFSQTGLFSAYVIGSAELVASTLLLLGLLGPRLHILAAIGSALGIAIMAGAISFHLFTPLGIVVQGDGGLLFFMAIGVLIANVIILINRVQALTRISRLFEV